MATPVPVNREPWFGVLDLQKGKQIFHSEADLKEKIGVQRRVLRSQSWPEPVLFGRSRSRCEGPAPAPP